ncbi:MAG: NAD(P)/FAD-dependent oxidoreductase [Planctomycetota bacterium]
MKRTKFDVVVVGGGPAGSTLAARLGRAGLHTLLLEKKRFPRFKPCGEFMSPECLPILAELGVADDVSLLGAARVGGMRLHGYTRTATGRFCDVGAARAPFAYGWAVRRERFDAVLLRAAAATPDVEVRQATAVVAVRRDAHGAVVGLRVADARGEHEIDARMVVGADGLRSRVARELGVQRPMAWLDKLALTTRYVGVPRQECAQVHFFPGGYFAATTVDEDVFSLNLVVDRARVGERTGDWNAFLASHLDRAPRLAEILQGAQRIDSVRGCGPLAMATTAQTFDGAALVGDACGYVDPVTGEGIFFALRGAQLLAPVLIEALADGDLRRRALSPYVSARRREFGPRLRLAKLLQRGLRHPRVVDRVLALLSARPRLADLLVSVTGDYVPGRELLRPGVWWRALRRGHPVPQPMELLRSPR